MKYCSDLNCIFTSFHFPDSGFNLLNGFDLSDVRLKTSNRVVPLFSCGGVYPKLRTSYLPCSAPLFASITPNICVTDHTPDIGQYLFLSFCREREKADVYTNAKKLGQYPVTSTEY